jgi:TIR domain
MFNVLISAIATAWETDQLMRMDASRFMEGGDGSEANGISLSKPETLKLLEQVPALLMYERGTQGPNTDIVRYGYLRDIRVIPGKELVFRFQEEGRFPRTVVQEYADRLNLGEFEQNRTHWAVKDAGIPSAMLAKLRPTYDVVFSFAGEDRRYVERVAKYLRNQGVRIFYDRYEETSLWGKDLAEHFDFVYRLSGQYCVVFISKHYVEKMWTRHERQSALARALKERQEYILPVRFDDTEVPGIRHTLAYHSAAHKSSTELGKEILKKLGRPVP